MADKQHHRFALAPCDSHRQFLLGIAMVSILPFLVFLYLSSRTEADLFGAINLRLWHLAMYTFIGIGVVGGIAVLRRHPLNIRRIRDYLQHLLHTEAAGQAGFIELGHDAASIQRGMDVIVQELKSRVHAAEREKAAIEKTLFLAEKMESLSTMAAGLSHDLNNYLTAILGNTNVLLRKLTPGSPLEVYIRQIESSTASAMELINQVSLYCGLSPMISEWLDISRLIAQMKDCLEAAATRNVNIRYELDRSLPPVCGDATQLRQVILNLVANAFEAMDEKGTAVISTGVVECDRQYLADTYLMDGLTEGSYVFIEVSDSGCGITPEAQERMFDPFFTTRLRGRGMGLAVTMGVVRGHGGALKVKSRPGEGSVVTVLLPISGMKRIPRRPPHRCQP